MLINVTACSYIKSLFPDKEKDYQYTAEIPPLAIPDDLKKGSAATSLEPKLPETSTQANPPLPENPAVEAPSTPAVKDEEPAAPEIETVEKTEKISVELIRFDDGENRLRLGVEKPRAWRLVSKALSRKSIEVTDRNQDEAYFVVQYDPDEQKVEDGSLWDEAVFMFRGFKRNEKEYRLKLEELDRKTEVIILDKDQQPLPNDSSALKLLTLVQTAIAIDLAEKQGS
jgi:outer membrane protein assembly factor BamC